MLKTLTLFATLALILTPTVGFAADRGASQASTPTPSATVTPEAASPARFVPIAPPTDRATPVIPTFSVRFDGQALTWDRPAQVDGGAKQTAERSFVSPAAVPQGAVPIFTIRF